MAGFPTIVVSILALILIGDVVMAVILGVVKPKASEGLASDNYTIVISSVGPSEITEPPGPTTAPPSTTTSPPPTTAAPSPA